MDEWASFVEIELWKMKSIRQALRRAESLMDELDIVFSGVEGAAHPANLMLMMISYRPVITGAIRLMDDARISRVAETIPE